MEVLQNGFVKSSKIIQMAAIFLPTISARSYYKNVKQKSRSCNIIPEDMKMSRLHIIRNISKLSVM